MLWDHMYVPKSFAKKGCIPQSLSEQVFLSSKDTGAVSNGPVTAQAVGPRTVGFIQLPKAV